MAGHKTCFLFWLFFVRFYSNATSPNEVRIMGGAACGFDQLACERVSLGSSGAEEILHFASVLFCFSPRCAFIQHPISEPTMAIFELVCRNQYKMFLYFTRFVLKNCYVYDTIFPNERLKIFGSGNWKNCLFKYYRMNYGGAAALFMQLCNRLI